MLVPDIGCTIPCIPESVAKFHGLKISELDLDEPNCEAYGGSFLQLAGQTTFWAAIDGLTNRRLVKALVVKADSQEILLSWQILKQWGVIGDNFSFPPKEHNRHISRANGPSDDVLDEDVSPPTNKVKIKPKLIYIRKRLLKDFADVFK